MKNNNKSEDRFFVVLNRNLFLRSLAAFRIQPASLYPSFADPLTGAAGNQLLLVRKGIPESWSEQIASSRENEFPVLLELNLGGLNKFFTENSMWALLPLCIPMTEVSNVFFPRKEQIEEFTVRRYDDVVTDLVPIKHSKGLFKLDRVETVEGDSPELFNSDKGSPSGDIPISEIQEAGLNEKNQAHHTQDDSVAGALCCLLKMLPDGARWHQSLIPIVLQESGPEQTNKISKDVLSAFVRLISPQHPRTTEYQIRSAIKVFMNNSLSDGWQSTQVLNEIASKIITAPSEEGIDAKLIDNWKELSLDILENKCDCDPLTDEGQVALRAILLACLRKKPETVASAADSYLRAGKMVTAIAGFLCGLSSGISSLPREMKLFDSKPDLAALIVRNLLLPRLQAAGVDIHPEDILLENKPKADLSSSLLIRKGKSVIYTKTVPVRAVYQQLIAMGRQMSLPIRGDLETGYLKFTHEWHSGRKQSVYIKSLHSRDNRDDMVRFISPFEELPKSFKGSNFDKLSGMLIKSRAKSINRDSLIKYLLWQSQEDIHCRLAIDPQLGCLCVIVDQIVSTLDREELSSHLMHIAEMADNLEEELGKDEF